MKSVFNNENLTKDRKGIQNMKKRIAKGIAYFNACLMMGLLTMTNVYATSSSNTSSIDTFIDFICDWLLKIGGVVALIGAVMFALGWQREDAEGKSRGLMTMMAGFMIVAISQAPGMFGL